LLHQDKRAFQLWLRKDEGLVREAALEDATSIPIDALGLNMPLDLAYEDPSFESPPA
jgi:hypothetical protein